MNWNWKKMISIVLVVTVCTTGSAIAQAVECDVPQYTFSDENIEIVDPALFYDLFTQTPHTHILLSHWPIGPIKQNDLLLLKTLYLPTIQKVLLQSV